MNSSRTLKICHACLGIGKIFLVMIFCFFCFFFVRRFRLTLECGDSSPLCFYSGSCYFSPLPAESKAQNDLRTPKIRFAHQSIILIRKNQSFLRFITIIIPNKSQIDILNVISKWHNFNRLRSGFGRAVSPRPPRTPRRGVPTYFIKSI